MKKERKAIAIIGEGITEKYYIESLKGMSPFTLLPQELNTRASSLHELEQSIKKAIDSGYDKVYCLIDMDGKTEGKSNVAYSQLKQKYHGKTHTKQKYGISCEVKFIETERCTELWFLYHFTKTAITRQFSSYEELVKELKKYRPNYEKKEKYFKSIGSIHKMLTNELPVAGSLEKAILNAQSSILSKDRDNRNYTYCEMSILIDELQIQR